MARLLSVLLSISYAKFSQILEVLRDFHHLFGSRNSPTTGILHSLRHIYKSEKISLALVQRSNDLRMTVQLAYCYFLLVKVENVKCFNVSKMREKNVHFQFSVVIVKNSHFSVDSSI